MASGVVTSQQSLVAVWKVTDVVTDNQERKSWKDARYRHSQEFEHTGRLYCREFWEVDKSNRPQGKPIESSLIKWGDGGWNE